MKRLFSKHFILTLAGVLAAAAALRAQQSTAPHIAYVYPAGGERGATFEVKVAGQYLAAITNAYVSGDGVQAVVAGFDGPLTAAQLTELREQQTALQAKRTAALAARNGGARATVPARAATNTVSPTRRSGTPAVAPARAATNTTAPTRPATNGSASVALAPRAATNTATLTNSESKIQNSNAVPPRAATNAASTNTAAPTVPQTPATWTVADMTALAEIRDKLLANTARQANPTMAQNVTLKITIAPDAEPGKRELRLGAPAALSQPLVFCVGQLPEFNKPKPPLVLEPLPAARAGNPAVQTAAAPVESHINLPCVVNGQIMPGGVDRYRFTARHGQRLVIAVAARELKPYLADAVPGWFQAAVSIFDSQGHEVAYADHYRYHPDPVLYYEAPKEDEYVLQIRDSIYRGRDDFVYRITVGEVPFVTGIFPLGGPAGAQTAVQVMGWNLPAASVTEDARELAPGVYPLTVRAEKFVAGPVPFAVDTLPECVSQKSNHSQAGAQTITLPIIVNGRIEAPGQKDVFRFQGRAGDDIVAEVIARRLESPLDSELRLTDAAGKQLAFNDDYEDKGAGLQTQYADSYLTATLPAAGAYYLWLEDAQHQGGPEFAYRLRVSQPRPDFALRVVPSSLAVRGGMSVPLTVYALRRDGFSNAITLSLKDAPAGFKLNGGPVPTNQDQVRLSLMAPAAADPGVLKLGVEGHALIHGEDVVRPAVPAEDMMQAFAYRHLVPSKELEVSILDRPALRIALQMIGSASVKIPAGGSAGVKVRTPGVAFTNNYQLELNAPPEGISIESVSSVGTELEVLLHSDAAKIKPGAKGNLIVNIMAKRPATAPALPPARANQPRPVLGVLPAITFEITAPPT
jgi:hypothetical protein